MLIRSWWWIALALLVCVCVLAPIAPVRAEEEPIAPVAPPDPLPSDSELSDPVDRDTGRPLVPTDAAGNAEATGSEPGHSILNPGTLRRVTLLEVVRMGLRANLTLLAGSFNPPIAMEQYRAASTIFDPLVSADLNLAHDEEPATAAFFGVDVFEEDTLGASAGISKRLKTGGTVSFLYRADRLDSNNVFNDLVPYWTNRAIVEGTQPLLRGAGDVVMTDIRLASNGVRISNENQRTLVQETLLSIVRAYWDLVYVQAEVISRLKSEDVAAELLQNAEARLAAKVGTPLDVAEARAGLERRRGNRITAEGLRGAAQDRLRALVMPFGTKQERNGVTFVATDDVDGSIGAVPTADSLQRYTDMALANRPEIRAAEAALSNRDIEIYAASNAVKPQVDLVGRLGTAGLEDGFDTAFGKMAGGQALSGAIGVRFSMFIGQRAARANLRLAEWARRQTMLNRREIENLVVAEVRAGVRNVLTAQAVEQAGAEEVRAATENLRGEQRRLDNGKSTPFRVLQKEDDLADARTRYLRSSADRRIAEAAFWRSVGFLAQTLGVGGMPARGKQP